MTKVILDVLTDIDMLLWKVEKGIRGWMCTLFIVMKKLITNMMMIKRTEGNEGGSSKVTCV